MKILQVFNRYREKGGEEVWVYEFENLAGVNHSVETLFFDSRDWEKSSLVAKLRQAFLIGNNSHSRSKLADHIKRQNPDALVFHNVLPVGSLGLFAEAQELGIPVLQYTHNFRPFSPSGTLWVNGEINARSMHGSVWHEVMHGAWGGSRLKTALLSFHLRRFVKAGMLDGVTHWLAISNFMRDQFIEAGIEADKITTLRHCRAVEKISKPMDDEGYYLFLGRLVEEKGCLFLVKSWLELEDRLGAKCPLLIIAGVGPCLAEIEALSAHSTKIKCVGFVSGSKKASLLQTCRALIAPSLWWEPLGLVAYDAYEYGKPVLASNSGGLLEVVTEAQGGSLFEPGEVHDLCEKISEMEEMPLSERLALGMRGHTWLLEQANPIQWRKDLGSILEKSLTT